jgi:hypothetical protein
MRIHSARSPAMRLPSQDHAPKADGNSPFSCLPTGFGHLSLCQKTGAHVSSCLDGGETSIRRKAQSGNANRGNTIGICPRL